jgi:hypothetical protein
MNIYRDVVQDVQGNALPGVSVAVYLAGTATLATIASDIDRTARANPMTTGADGSFEFWVDPGKYDIELTGTGVFVAKEVRVSAGMTHAVTAETVGSSATTNLTPFGATTTTAKANYVVNRTGNLTRVNTYASASPGTGQTFAYTIFHNGVSAGTITVAGANSSGTFTAQFPVVAGDFVRLQLVTSGTASTADHRAVVEFC